MPESGAGWSGRLQSHWTTITFGFASDPGAPGAEGSPVSMSSCFRWSAVLGGRQAVLGGRLHLRHSLAQCPSCRQIRHFPSGLLLGALVEI